MLYGGVLHVGSTLVLKNGRPVDREYNDLAFIRACTSRPCALTFTIEPARCIT
jgi:hypothetical protein